MHRSRTYDATGIILRSRPLGDTDRIAVLYSLEEGKLSAVA
ncbi:MAG: DNA repair protein RecO, partial [Armatimonadetes bacterium]|nr:DNA repair protein RecO [Armatimonadota bacterium]